MFIFSIRASSIKFFAILALTFAILLGLMLSGNTVPASGASVGEVNFSDVKTEDDRVAFIEQFGLRVKSAATDASDFVMPENFDRVILGYNQIQKAQGLDLTKYQKKRVTHYAYEVTNYDYNGTVYVNLLVYRNRIIAADISSAADGGFVYGLLDFDTTRLK